MICLISCQLLFKPTFKKFTKRSHFKSWEIKIKILLYARTYLYAKPFHNINSMQFERELHYLLRILYYTLTIKHISFYAFTSYKNKNHVYKYTHNTPIEPFTHFKYELLLPVFKRNTSSIYSLFHSARSWTHMYTLLCTQTSLFKSENTIKKHKKRRKIIQELVLKI